MSDGSDFAAFWWRGGPPSSARWCCSGTPATADEAQGRSGPLPPRWDRVRDDGGRGRPRLPRRARTGGPGHPGAWPRTRRTAAVARPGGVRPLRTVRAARRAGEGPVELAARCGPCSCCGSPPASSRPGRCRPRPAGRRRQEQERRGCAALQRRRVGTAAPGGIRADGVFLDAGDVIPVRNPPVDDVLGRAAAARQRRRRWAAGAAAAAVVVLAGVDLVGHPTVRAAAPRDGGHRGAEPRQHRVVRQPPAAPPRRHRRGSADQRHGPGGRRGRVRRRGGPGRPGPRRRVAGTARRDGSQQARRRLDRARVGRVGAAGRDRGPAGRARRGPGARWWRAGRWPRARHRWHSTGTRSSTRPPGGTGPGSRSRASRPGPVAATSSTSPPACGSARSRTRLRITQPLFDVEVTVPGDGAILSDDGDYLLTRVDEPDPQTVVSTTPPPVMSSTSASRARRSPSSRPSTPTMTPSSSWSTAPTNPSPARTSALLHHRAHDHAELRVQVLRARVPDRDPVRQQRRGSPAATLTPMHAFSQVDVFSSAPLPRKPGRRRPRRRGRDR